MKLQSVTAGVTGNPIPLVFDPGGMNPLADSIPGIEYTSCLDPPQITLTSIFHPLVAKSILEQHVGHVDVSELCPAMEIGHETVFMYLQCAKYPEGSSDNQKRAIRNKSKKFTIQDGMLHYVSKNGLRQWIADQCQQQKIIAACHADMLGGHFGRDKTREKITSRYK